MATIMAANAKSDAGVREKSPPSQTEISTRYTARSNHGMITLGFKLGDRSTMYAFRKECGVRIRLVHVRHSSILDPVERISRGCMEDRLNDRMSGMRISVVVVILKARKNDVMAIFSYSTLSIAAVEVEDVCAAMNRSSTFIAT